MNPVIQKTTKESLERVYEIIYNGWIETYTSIGVSKDLIDLRLEKNNWLEKYQQFLKRETSIAFSFSIDGLIVGAISAFQKENTIRIFSLYVDKSYQGTGIGSSLIKKIIQDNSMVDIYVATLSENISAQEFYKKMGFIETGKLIPFDFGDGVVKNDIEFIYKEYGKYNGII